MLALDLTIASSYGATYNALADYDTTQNPTSSGVWSYGDTAGLGGTFTLFNNFSLSDGYVWETSGSGGYPDVSVLDGLLTLAASSSEDAVVRWTAPSTGTYSVKGAFTGLLYDVHVLEGGAREFDGNPAGYTTQTFSFDVNLTTGQTVDFVTGNGRVDLDATISTVSTVPDGGLAITMLGIATSGLAFIRRKQ
jgi:hypothetical protein